MACPACRAELGEQGVRVGGKRIARLMRAAELHGVSKRRGFVVTTQRDTKQCPAPDLVKREFKADGPNQLWVADMTYVPIWASRAGSSTTAIKAVHQPRLWQPLHRDGRTPVDGQRGRRLRQRISTIDPDQASVLAALKPK